MAIFDYQPMQPNTPASFYDIAYRRPREMTREDLGLSPLDMFDMLSMEEMANLPASVLQHLSLLDTDVAYAFWLGADA